MTPLTRRSFLASTAAATVGVRSPAGAADFPRTRPPKRTKPAAKQVAVVASVYWYLSHAYHIAGRFLDGYMVGDEHHFPDFGVASVYADQHRNDLSRDLAKEHGFRFDTVQMGVDTDAALLGDRITARVDRMWQLGLVAEVRTLIDQGLRDGRTASRALGYAQVLSWLDGDLPSEEAARAATVSATRRFARRQRSWFRRDPRITWLTGGSDTLQDSALRLLYEGHF